MAINKVVYGAQTLIDITDTTATADKVANGEVFYSASGTRTVGTASLFDNDKFTRLGWCGTYYNNSTGSSGSPNIFYYFQIGATYFTKNSDSQATVNKAGKYLIHLTTSSTNNMNSNDWCRLNVNGVQVAQTPSSSYTHCGNVAIVDLKVGDIIGGVVHHTSTSYRVDFSYDFYYYDE